MRILILATDIYTRGGVARYTATLAAALSGLPASVDVLPLFGDAATETAPGAKSHGFAACLAEKLSLSGQRLKESIKKESFAVGPESRRLSARQAAKPQPLDAPAVASLGSFRVLVPTSRELTATVKIRHALRALRQARSSYDLVICSHLSQAPIAAMIGLRCGTPYVVVAHGSEAWIRLPMLKRLALRGARAVLAVSAYTGHALAAANRIPPARVKVIYNAIPEELVQALTSGSGDPRSRPGRPQEPPLHSRESGQPQGPPLQRMLLSVASLKPEHAYKGVDTVIQALPQIAAAVPEVRYVVAGAGEDRARLEQLASTMGIHDRVAFAGEVSDAELANLYRACDVFVLPSRASQRDGDRWEGEGFGRVYVEAALAGKPVVGSTEGGAAEALGDGRTGLLADPRSVTAVASAVTRLLQSPELAASLGAEGRRWAVERFTVAAMRRALARFLGDDLLLRESFVRRPLSVVRGPSLGPVGPTMGRSAVRDNQPLATSH